MKEVYVLSNLIDRSHDRSSSRRGGYFGYGCILHSAKARRDETRDEARRGQAQVNIVFFAPALRFDLFKPRGGRNCVP